MELQSHSSIMTTARTVQRGRPRATLYVGQEGQYGNGQDYHDITTSLTLLTTRLFVLLVIVQMMTIMNLNVVLISEKNIFHRSDTWRHHTRSLAHSVRNLDFDVVEAPHRKGRAGCWLREGVAPSRCEGLRKIFENSDAKSCILVTTCREISCFLKTAAKKLGTNTLLVPNLKVGGPASPGLYGCCAYVWRYD